MHSFTSVMRSSNVAFYTPVVIGFANPITVVYGKHNLSADFSFSSFFHVSSPTSQSPSRLDDRSKQKEWACGAALQRDVNLCRSGEVAARRIQQAATALKPEQTGSGVAKHVSGFCPQRQVVTLCRHRHPKTWVCLRHPAQGSTAVNTTWHCLYAREQMLQHRNLSSGVASILGWPQKQGLQIFLTPR